jgi:hypothetical protein
MNGGKTMISRTYTARMKRVRSMAKGLTGHLDPMEKQGATPEFLASLALFQENLHQIQRQRQVLKKTSMQATAAKNCNLKEAERLCSQARKWVRRELPAEAWTEFGFRKGEYGKTTFYR